MKNKKSLWLMKLGGSVVTDKYSETPKISNDLSRIAKEIKTGYDPEDYRMILVHGAGSYAHSLVKESGIYAGIKNKKQIKAFSKTERLCRELNSIFVKHLEDANLPVFPLQVSSSTVMNGGNIERMDTSVISGLLDYGIIPVLYGEPAYDRNQGCSILSSDQILPYLAKEL
ncbi:MAG: acetylglutamate kinase, partial [Nanoarchaeota archaeon]|nr:acetylglutamate kinase [Nanoarchaeota archaeon]